MDSSREEPLLIAGGGVSYSDANAALDSFVRATGIAVAETQAGKGSLPFDHPQQLGSMGVTGSSAANLLARDADLVIAAGTRLSDFTTSSRTAFQNRNIRFLNININELDAMKHGGLALVADAKTCFEELTAALGGFRVSPDYAGLTESYRGNWVAEVERHCGDSESALTQTQVIGVVNDFSSPRDVVVCAAGSLPGDLHKLWKTRDPRGYHVEYGYSCMGYEIAGGLGVKMADPSRDVYVMVGDGSYQMMSSEIATSLQEGMKLNIILIDNHGFGSIGNLSKSVGSRGFGTEYRFREPQSGQLDGDLIPVDYAANARSYGAHVFHASTRSELKAALEVMRQQRKTTLIVVQLTKDPGLPDYESWWDVPVAEVSEDDDTTAARKKQQAGANREQFFLHQA